MTIEAKFFFEKVRHHHAITKNLRFDFAKRAIKFRESISCKFQRRFLVDDSILIDDSIVFDDH
jgi:hypothetical protein